ncbi:flagellar inner dynein arm light chain [Micromonas pusilla CCMP1545]|uniref:Flagellar inner dynein arm light chain n=1 Tax=Micromonas pusilla (strain CCMP1545) TaxID=564608 RepID=C1MVY2_MICPC|nr:flagellar inner dynein arm light chain [Micromonas pusilla CCMP1545]EEH56070.1 flagellar inner dynein arm light chain [Micromonas pusilla CCMP1545]|eukprot:XP_003060118.1 flagellar inner dynein arm light chain [Micromonas pusilla CCMP1545]
MLPPLHTLVLYDQPQTVRRPRASLHRAENEHSFRSLRFASPRARKGDGGAAKTQTEDILNSILPPREHVEDGTLWVQYVAPTPATRLDVINLQEKLDARLQARPTRQARETGLCPVREELYAQCLDEMIRQVTINCAERGLLLLRIRDEMRMTIQAYQTLYESSVAFGVRKALQTEQGKSDMEARILQARSSIALLETDKADLERQCAEWKAKCEAIEKRESERRADEEAKHGDEIAYLNRSNKQLKAQLDKFLSPEAAAKK